MRYGGLAQYPPKRPEMLAHHMMCAAAGPVMLATQWNRLPVWTFLAESSIPDVCRFRSARLPLVEFLAEHAGLFSDPR